MISVNHSRAMLNTNSNPTEIPPSAGPHAGSSTYAADPVAAPPATLPLSLTLFGAMTVTDATGRDATPRIRKSRAVLAILALAAPMPILRDRFAALLWSRRDRDQGRASLRQCVHEIQALFALSAPSVLIADRNHISLDRHALRLDARLGVISALPLLADLDGLDPAFDLWLHAERRRFSRAAIAVAEAALRNPATLAIAPDLAIAAAEQLLGGDPVHEAAWRVLIAGHLARGDREAATDAYRQCVATLADRTGLAPAPETQALLSLPRAIPAALHVPAPVPAAIRRTRGLRLGVRPFRSLDGTADDPLSLGLAEEITTALARFRWFFLVASPTLVAHIPGAGTDTERWRDLGLDFMLDGTIQRSGAMVRISVRLLDVHGGPELIWAARFDRPATDLLSLQDEISAECVAQIDPAVLIHEGARAASTPQHYPGAYGLTISAVPAIYRLEEAAFRAAGEALEAAVREDPDYAPSHTWYACWHLFYVGQNWAEDPEAAMIRAAELAERAVALDPSDARAVTISGHVKAFLNHRVDEATQMHERAISLNPNLPLAWGFAALADCYAGRHEQAISRVHHARRLSPFDPHGFFLDMALMLARLLRGEFEVALAIGRQSLTLNPAFTSTYKIALCALGHLGRGQDIAPLKARLLALEPGFSVSASVARTPLQQPDDLALYAEGLRLAGLPE